MIRTGEQYRDSIKDGRLVYMNGEKVKDVTQHPQFKPLVDIRARIYDMQHDKATAPVMTYQDDAGESCSVGLKLPSLRTTGKPNVKQPMPCSKTSAAW